MKPVIDVDQISDALCQSAEELRTCYTRQYSKTMPRSGKSTAATSYLEAASALTALSKLSDHTAAKAPPPVPQEKATPDTEKSIYDKEPEHYYENVEKDATGRLLNRDTNAFRLIEGGAENLANVRSNSGEDLSAAVRSAHSDENSAVAIYRSSRSVDNIFSDEKSLQTNQSGSVFLFVRPVSIISLLFLPKALRLLLLRHLRHFVSMETAESARKRN